MIQCIDRCDASIWCEAVTLHLVWAYYQYCAYIGKDAAGTLWYMDGLQSYPGGHHPAGFTNATNSGGHHPGGFTGEGAGGGDPLCHWWDEEGRVEGD